MAQIKRTEARLRQIRTRQWDQKWGVNYVAATFADPKEAPGISSGTVLTPIKLGQRKFHTLSSPETFLSILALFHPDCWDLHEQHVLFPKPRPHPLTGHPLARGAQYAPFKGTLDVVARMGISHPRIMLRLGDEPRDWPLVPFPYTGDLRLFMASPHGPYCVNWPVKNKYLDFRQKGPQSKPRPLDDPDDPSSILRQELESIYSSDAEIRTNPVSLDRLEPDFYWNLRDVYLDDTYDVPIDNSGRAEATAWARSFIGSDTPIYAIAKQIAIKFRILDRQAVALIYQGIWRRELRVDLFRPIATAYPLRAERVDPLKKYAAWFAR